jgi:hypothetical protein
VALPGMSGAAPLASAFSPANLPPLSAPIGGHAVRPQPIDRGLDGWFLDKLFGRR